MDTNLFQAICNAGSVDDPAILYEQRQISYGELRNQALDMARVLRLLEVRSGDRVALLLADSPEFVGTFIAVCSYGAIAVPINMGLRLDEQRAILNDCSASLAFVEEDLSQALLADALKKLPDLKQVVVVGREQRRQKLASEPRRGDAEAASQVSITNQFLTDVIAQSRSQSTPAFVSSADDQAAFILYTSGSTGEPKGAVHRQSDIFYTNETYCHEVLRLREGDRLFSSSRLPFAYGLGNAFTFPLLNGRTTILCREKPTPEIISKVFADYRPTIFFGVPVVYRLLLDEFNKQSNSVVDCSSLRLCISAGEALPAPLGEEWEKTFGVPILDGIGSTEMLHMWMSNHEGENVYGSSGRLLGGYEARLLDPEGKTVTAGVEGNLWVKGASAALEYWQRTETTQNTFVEGWVRTGDLYRQDTQGYWFHMGRSDDCFKSSGQWVSPVEVEGVLLRQEGVNRVAVVEDFDDDGLPCACAFVVRSTTPGGIGLERSLRELARASLPRFKRPRRYVFVDQLPYTATGKIQRFKLRERLKTGPSPNVPMQ
ncbi:MAG TPA: benzoate-CoA ligase family protein [Pyrinomonadaceae bacterium]|nr:benzoate-CoA ligase family protein [Pyrinomonadaceae bacterium]